MSNIATVAELKDLLAGSAPPRVLDVRWRLDRPDGRAEYLDWANRLMLSLGRPVAPEDESEDGVPGPA